MLLISCEISLELKWGKNCVITSLEGRQVAAGPPVVRDDGPTSATLNITDCKLYILVYTISRNNEYTTGNLLDYDYFKKYYKLIAIDLSKQQVLQENEDLIQQINFIGRLEAAANFFFFFFIIEKKEHIIF